MEFVVLVVAAVVFAIVGIRIGMLAAPRIERLGAPRDPENEDPRADDRR
jgi:hypothetical protein